MSEMNRKLETTQHIVLKVLMSDYGAYQVAKEMYSNRIRLDVKCDKDLTKLDKKDLEMKVNAIINRNLDVSEAIYDIEDVLVEVDLSLLPEGVEKVRVISIGEFDSQPCDDPHVSNTSEIGKYKLLKLEKIGKDTYRFVNSVEEEKTIETSKKIEPRTLKGFRDFLPEELRFRKAVFKVFEGVFEKYGFEPLETPALEYFDILMGKYGEEEKLVYNFEDSGDRRVAMKYDLTVPTARVLAQYQDKIKLPWKRYQIQPVWRADNTQKGRFREFYQCDADCLGTGSMGADAEFIKMAIEILEKLGFKEFKVMINNRKILNAIAEYAGAKDKFFDIVYSIDKWYKRTPEETREDLKERGLDEEQANRVFECIELEGKDDTEKLKNLREKIKDTEEGKEGVDEMLEIVSLVGDSERLSYTPTIARGLAYYTGPVWEINITEGNIGSVAGCGRYDELVGSYLGRNIPATGGSFGIERIMEVMKDLGMELEGVDEQEIEMVAMLPGFEKEAFELADKLRKEGKKIFLYPDSNKKLGKQIEFADKKGFSKVYILGEDEVEADGKPSVKELSITK
ncbi:histidine--tRNA ligase [Candidatus Dojkabacteria bacterium]|nr:histidine--tRNA ligase [Candidatus Dojkabacteria bacterium]